MSKETNLCASSQRPVPEGGAVHCVCGRRWEGIDCVPLHDEHGHIMDPEKLRRRADASNEVYYRRKREREERGPSLLENVSTMRRQRRTMRSVMVNGSGVSVTEYPR